MYELHNSDNMFDLTTKVLDVLFPNWKDKIIGVTTNGASNMTGCHVGMLEWLHRFNEWHSQVFITFGVLLINWI
jgi:hypothetical protein